MGKNVTKSTPIRVLYIARAPFVSGAERALISTLRHLDRARVEPLLVLGHETHLVEQAQQLNIPVEIIPLIKRSRRTPLGWWRSVRLMHKLFKDVQPDIVHANDVPSCQAMSVVGGHYGVPRVLHIRWGITAADAAWWAAKGVEVVICISRWVKQQLGRIDPPLNHASIEVIHDAVDWPANKRNGYHDSNHTGQGASSDPVAQSCPQLVDGPSLGFAGQLIESKGLDLVIRAVGQLPTRRRPQLIVAGEDTQTQGAYRRQLEDLASQCGVADRITWLGFVQDVATLYRRVSAVVCPSRLEPLGLVPLEAAEFALPTLANRVGGLAETIQDGQTGYLIDPTVEAWAEAIERVHDADALATLGKAAYEQTHRDYAPCVYQEQLMAIYDRLVAST